MPAIFLTFLVVLYKGDLQTSLDIHNSWVEYKDILVPQNIPSSLDQERPLFNSAIGSIGWTPVDAVNYIKIANVNIASILWPVFYFLFISFFIGDKKNLNENLKRIIVLSQLLFLSPIFIFSCDYGRVLSYLSITSVLLYGFLVKSNNAISNGEIVIKKDKIFSKIFRSISIEGKFVLIYLILSFPACCINFITLLKQMPLYLALKTILKLSLQIFQI